MADKVAVIDTGTNSTRLLVVDTERVAHCELARHTEITRLGAGIEQTGRLDPAARSRVEECIGRYHRIIADYGVGQTLLFATSSVRDAADGPGFIKDIARRYAYSFKILSGEEEASYAFFGVAIGADNPGKKLVFDIGGGSTEIATGSGSTVDYSRSLQLGCVRIKERFLTSDPPAAAELMQAREMIELQIREAMPAAALAGVEVAFAVAGTMTTLAALDMKLQSYDREAVHGYILSASRIDSLLESLAVMTSAQRQAITTMERGRADVITAGALIASVIMKVGGLAAVTISESDILDGVAVAFSRGSL